MGSGRKDFAANFHDAARIESSPRFEVIEGTPVDADVYAELLRSYDAGVAEFLDLESAKPNTLGNTRMLKILA